MSSNNNNTTIDSDEAMAAAMQEQFRREFLERQAHRNPQAHNAYGQQQGNPNPPPPTAPSSMAASMNPMMTTTSANHNDEPEIRLPSPQELADEEYARRLAAASSDSTDIPPPPPPMIDDGDNPDRYASIVEDSDDARMAQQLQDEEYARNLAAQQQQQRPEQAPPRQPFIETDDPDLCEVQRIAQELEDEELARRYSQMEQEISLQQREQREQNRARNRRSRLIWSRLVPLTFCAAALTIALLFVFDVFNAEDIPGLGQAAQNWIDSDPFDGDVNRTNPEGAYAWNNQGAGLQLKVVNALQDNWQSIFQQALQDWDNGSPDALSLVTERIEHEIDCSVQNGILKVCNGNYGDTRWRGLNEVKLDRRAGTILGSSAKLNEFYLTSASNDQRQYTMCHEIGHGFGLPHWDEDFFNKV